MDTVFKDEFVKYSINFTMYVLFKFFLYFKFAKQWLKVLVKV